MPATSPITEHKTRALVLSGPGAPEGAVVIVSRGIAAEDHPQWPRNTAYFHGVISRTMTRVFDTDETRAITTASRDGVTG